MIFKYPYTDLYNLNLDWILQAIKEIQQITGELGTLVNSVNGMTGDVEITSAMITEIMGTIVTSLNGQSGDVTLTASDLLTILGGAVTSFNARQGDVTLTASDINDTMIDITWTSDPGDILSDLTQADLDSMYEDGKRILIFLNNLSVPDQIYFLTLVGGEVTAQAYTPTASMAGVTTVNGYSGAVNLYADNIYLANDSEDTIEDALNDVDTALAGKQDTLTFDNTPTALSDNPVTSGGIASALSSLNTSLGGAINGVAANLGDLEGALAYVAVKTGNDWYAPSSPATIPEGSYIEIDHHIYTASTDITADAQLVVGSNITAVPDGALNQINGNLTWHITEIYKTSPITIPASREVLVNGVYGDVNVYLVYVPSIGISSRNESDDISLYAGFTNGTTITIYWYTSDGADKLADSGVRIFYR